MAIAMSAPKAGTEIRRITMDDLKWALREGWADFRARRGDLLMLPLVYVLVGVLAAFLAYNADLFPFLFPAAAGFALVGPVAAAGFYELARRRESGLDSGWSHFLDPMRGRSRWPLLGLSLMMTGLFLVWIWIAGQIYGATLARHGPLPPAEFIGRLLTTPEGLQMVMWGNLIGAGFALAALAMSAISFPLAVDKGIDALSALGVSLGVFAKNTGTMLAWGLIVAAILVVASIPLFVGLLVALPVLGYATWHLYTRAVVR
ncbi:DUF2189 domain-containing protein [Sandaracinobacteroides hominis]|uniref:DUF2189 domain-containing protein n=1 Tax=Sandaracinobacteroides hominis TaxID=2780086 RepID=UPI002E2B3FAA|nr:DUF2189 domain-containing protein [Sandaracinobacteroides hominis]